jgi:hypothetical protein
MHHPRRFAALALLLPCLAVLGLAACDRGNGSAGGGQASNGHDDDGHTAHSAKYGGKLIEVGDHCANVEFVLNEEAGELTLHGHDAHAEHPKRLKQETIVATVTAGGETFDVTLNAQANELTGETVGDTSEFVGTHEKLKGVHEFKIVIKDLEIGGEKHTIETDLDFEHDHEGHDHDH